MTDPTWRIRGRWSKEGTFVVRAPTMEIARQHMMGLEAQGNLSLADAEEGTEAEYFQTFKGWSTTGKSTRPIPAGATIFVVENVNPISSARMRLRERYGAKNPDTTRVGI